MEPGNLKRPRRRTKERPATGMGRFWLRFAAIVFYPLTALLARVRVHGLANIPATGPVVLVLNHVSHLDPLYDAVTVHRAAQIPRFMAKNTLWNVPVLRNVLDGVAQIPVVRQTTDAQKSLQAAHDALETGKVVIIYPDGTVTKDPDGWPMVPKAGVARLALEHDVPIVPIARWGTRDLYNHYEKKFRPFPRKTVHLRVGEPLDVSEFRGKPADNATLRAVSELAMGRVRELLGEIREQQPPAEFYSPARRRVQGGSAGGSRDGAAEETPQNGAAGETSQNDTAGETSQNGVAGETSQNDTADESPQNGATRGRDGSAGSPREDSDDLPQNKRERLQGDDERA